jgi:hypothetical protein
MPLCIPPSFAQRKMHVGGCTASNSVTCMLYVSTRVKTCNRCYSSVFFFFFNLQQDILIVDWGKRRLQGRGWQPIKEALTLISPGLEVRAFMTFSITSRSRVGSIPCLSPNLSVCDRPGHPVKRPSKNSPFDCCNV